MARSALACNATADSSTCSEFSPFSNPAIAFVLCDAAQVENFVLHPLEASVLGISVSPKRRSDFRLGRAAARQALEAIGYPVLAPVLKGAHSEPVWPNEVVGSIAHGSGYGVAAVAWQQDVPAIGVDIQKIEERYTDELIARFADSDEFDWVRSDPAKRTERAVKLFSAKESVFKAIYPLGRVWCAFDVLHLTPAADDQGFKAKFRLPSISSGDIEMDVGISCFDGHIITGALLARPLDPSGMISK